MQFLIQNWGNQVFWEELNLGYYQMKDEYDINFRGVDVFNLGGRDSYYRSVLSGK